MNPVTVEGRESLRGLSIPTPFDTLLESYLELIESLTEEIQKLEKTVEERWVSEGNPTADEYFQRELLHGADDLRGAGQYHPI